MIYGFVFLSNYLLNPFIFLDAMNLFDVSDDFIDYGFEGFIFEANKFGLHRMKGLSKCNKDWVLFLEKINRNKPIFM